MAISESRARYWASVFVPLALMGVAAFFLPFWVSIVAVLVILAWPRR